MTQGIHANVFINGREVGQCLLIGASIPKLHHSDGMPVYLVTEHEDGAEIMCKDGRARKVATYPSAWPGPGDRSETRVARARHEMWPFDAPLPLFDEIFK